MMKFVVLLCLVASAIGGTTRSNPRPRLDGRVIGGTPTSIEEHPYQVSLQFEGNHICGGSIISPEWVLTAAHCAITSTKGYTIRVGSSNYGSGGKVYNLTEVIGPDRYETFFIERDIVLYRVSEPIALGPTQNVIALPAQDEALAAGTAAVLTGWGFTTEGGSLSTVLQEVTVPIVDQDVCSAIYDDDIAPSMMCAGGTGNGFCNRDGGGPLVAGGKIVGIASFRYRCGLPNIPEIYTRVASLRDWITNKTGV